MSETKAMVVITSFCLLVITSLWLSDIDQIFDLNRAENPVQVTHKGKKARSAIDHSSQQQQTEPLPIDQILPELQRLSAPFENQLDTDQEITQLREEADQLIEDMDQFLAEIEVQQYQLSPEDDEILQDSEFQQDIEQQTDLEQGLQSLP